MLTGAERKKACGCCDWDRHSGAQSLLLGTAIALSLSALAALIFFSSSSADPRFVWLENRSPIHYPDRCTTLFTLVGLTGSAAWLVSASDRKVLGVPIGQLLRWAYPSAVPGYFALFLPTILLGALSANSGARAATTLALVSALLQFFCLMYINFRLLLSADRREHIVYAYYMDRLTACPVNDKKFSTPGILHMTAECARLLLTEEMRINSAETLELWHQAIYKLLCHDWNRDMEKKNHPPASLENRADVVGWLQAREQRGEEAPCWLLKASDAWCILLRAPLSSTQKESAVQKLLYRMAHKKDPDYFTYMALLAGLVLALFRLHDQDQDGGKRLFSDLRLILGPVKQDTLDSLLSEETDEPIFRYELTRLQQRYLIGGFGIAAVLFRKINRQPRGDKSRFSLLAQYRDSYADEIPPAAAPVAAGSAEEAHRLTGLVEPSHIYLDATQEVTGDPPPSQAEIFARLCGFQALGTAATEASLFSAQLELVLWLVEWGYRTQYGISYTRFIDWCGPGVSAAMNRDFTIPDDDPYYRTKFLREMIKREKTDGK